LNVGIRRKDRLFSIEFQSPKLPETGTGNDTAHQIRNQLCREIPLDTIVVKVHGNPHRASIGEWEEGGTSSGELHFRT